MSEMAPSIYGLDASPLPAGCTPLSAIAILKVLTADGTDLVIRNTLDLTSWERLGMLMAAAELERQDMIGEPVQDDEDGES